MSLAKTIHLEGHEKHQLIALSWTMTEGSDSLAMQGRTSVSGLDHKSIVAMSQLCTEAELKLLMNDTCPSRAEQQSGLSFDKVFDIV